jgi:2-haloacid dehalogenase
MSGGNLDDVRALAFDVFGTVVDWRGSIIDELTAFGRERGLDGVDWAGLTDDWRAGYRPAMQRVRDGTLPWTNLDALHRLQLDDLLERYGVRGLAEADVRHLNTVWHRLKPWPDSVPGLTRLRTRFILATLSNGNVALLVNMAKAAGLPWDCVLSAELCRHYKRDPEVYRMACGLLGLEPGRVMMVAAHNDDLEAAAREGLRTAFVRRPTEYGPRQARDLGPEGDWDAVAEDMNGLADILLGGT